MGYLLTIINRIWEGIFSAIGGHLTLSLGGILFLGFPVSFWFGSYGYAIVAKSGISLVSAFSVGILLAGVSGLIFAFFYTRLSNDSFAVITLASVLAVEALISSWDSLTGGVLGIAGVPRLGFGKTLVMMAVVQGGIVIIALGCEWLLVRSKLGRSLRAIKENKSALTALGTSAKQVGQMAVLSACLFTGLAGILTVSRIQFLDPSLGGIVLLIQILTIAIMVHTPSITRLLGTTALIIILPEILRFFDFPVSILGYMRNLLYGLILLILIHYVVYNSSLKRHV